MHHIISSCAFLSWAYAFDLGQWENHLTVPECSWARSVRKLNDYSGVLLWIMSLTYGHDRTSTASYVARVGYEGSGHAYALHLHCLKFIYIEVLCWNEMDMRRIVSIYMRSIVSFIIWGVLSYSYVEVVHLFYIMSLISLWKFCWINNLIMNLLFIIMTSILLWLNWCLIKL